MAKDTSRAVQYFVDLVQHREAQYLEQTEEILAAIAPTVLTALYKMFSVPVDAINWYQVEIVDDILMLVATVSYEAGKEPSETIRQLFSQATTDGKVTEHLFRVGIPLNMIFDDPNAIIECIVDATTARETPREEQSTLPTEFTAKLTDEQLTQAILFETMNKGIKH